MKFKKLILGNLLILAPVSIVVASCIPVISESEQSSEIRKKYFENNEKYNKEIANFAKKLEDLNKKLKDEKEETKKHQLEQAIFGLYFQSKKTLDPLVKEYNYLFRKLREAENAENSRLKTIKIFHSNDEHGRLEFDAGKYSKFIGMIDFSKYLADKNKDLLLSAGDLIQGLPLSDSDKGQTIAQIARFAGYDTVAVGNHEFDYGLGHLLKLNKEISEPKTGTSTPFISANIYYKDYQKSDRKPENYDQTKVGKRVFKPYIIKKLVGGIKVAVFGITTPDTVFTSRPSNSELVEFRDPVESANQVISEIKAENPDINFIVAVTHLGTGRNEKKWTSEFLSQNSDSELDLIIDGHSHTYVEINKKAAENRDVYITQTSHYTKFLGDIDLVFDTKTGKITEVHQVMRDINQIELYNRDLPSKLVQKLRDNFDKEGKVVVFTSPGEFKHTISQKIGGEDFWVGRLKPTSLGVIAADTVAWGFTKEEPWKTHTNWESGSLDNTIGIYNSGGLRSNYEKGEITKEKALSVSPFGDLITAVRTKGDVVIQALKHGLSRGRSGGFAQVSSNVSYNVRVEKKLDDKTKKEEYFWIPDEKSFKINNKTIDPEKYYYIATNDFILDGGDGYKMLDKKDQKNKITLAFEGSKFIDSLIEFAKLTTDESKKVQLKKEKFERPLTEYLDEKTYAEQKVTGIPSN